MSGECDKCSEHATECMCNKKDRIITIDRNYDPEIDHEIASLEWQLKCWEENVKTAKLELKELKILKK